MTYTWQPLYRELALTLLDYRSKQNDLIGLLRDLRDAKYPVVPLEDKDKAGRSFPLEVIDPFTFFASFNRYQTERNRKQILASLKDRLQLHEAVPDDFSGLPLANNQHSWFFGYAHHRQAKDLDTLWDLAESVIKANSPADVPAERFDAALNVWGIGRPYLTIGCFWLNPGQFLAIDSVNREYFKQQFKLDLQFTNFESYLDLLTQVRRTIDKPFPELSFAAYQLALQQGKAPIPELSSLPKPPLTMNAPSLVESKSATMQPEDEYPLSQLATETGLAEAELQLWLEAIERKGQAIIYGPPGTGKTFVAERIAKHLTGGSEGCAQLVQFHPEYAYQDFMQGIRPTSRNGQLSYDLVPGVFLKFCREAEERNGLCVLIIDEINRANLARVFGELMYLLEYRNRTIALAGGEAFRIPGNVRLIGTMNTADRSIALVDYALRRRFAFLRLAPNYDILHKFHRGTGFEPSGLIEVLRRINSQIGDFHYEIGISFFMRSNLPRHLETIWRLEIEPYLEEFFFDHPAKVEPFRWSAVQPLILS